MLVNTVLQRPEEEISNACGQPRIHSEALSQINRYNSHTRCNNKISSTKEFNFTKVVFFSDIEPPESHTHYLSSEDVILCFDLCGADMTQSFWGVGVG